MKSLPADAPARVATVIGTFNGSAVITQGSGFTVTRTSAGNYTVRFSPRFRALLSFVASSMSGATSVLVVNGAFPADGSVPLIVFATNTAGTPQDGTVTFTATGIAP